MTNKPNILVVDDDNQIRELLKEFLQKQGWHISTASNPEEARQVLTTVQPDLIILDVMMPNETGFEFLEKLRKTNDVAVLMLTAKMELDDKVEGLLKGADDYLTKPFEPDELLLRVKAILRRVNPEINTPNIVIGDMEYECEKAIIKVGDNIIKLTESENEILHILATNAGTVFSREELCEKVNRSNDERTIDVQITRIRKKIESDSKTPMFLQTARGKGYVLRIK
ncbi:MAG: response regulator transcription factor [Alphaproteobacteria bacterium]